MAKRRIKDGKQSLSLMVDKFLLNCRARNFSGRTVETYEQRLRHFLGHIGDVKMTSIDGGLLSSFTSHLLNNVKPATVNNYLRTLSSFFSFCNTEIKIQMVKEEKTVIESLTDADLKKLLRQPDRGTFSGKRDYAILLLLLDTGVRISEALSLTSDDILLSDQTCVIRKGKGGKGRVVPISDHAAAALGDYLLQVDDLPGNRPTFISAYDNQLQRWAFYKRIRMYARDAGIKKSVGPHLLRHTFARLFLTSGGDIRTLQKLLGHSTPDMSLHYVSVFDDEVREQHRRHSPLESLIKNRRRK